MTFHVKQKMCSAGCGRPRDLGYSTYCRECRNDYMRQTRPKHRELSPEARKRSNCRRYTNILIARGQLVPGACEDCGTDQSVEPHHDDYDDPRAVRWKCTDCHRKHHKGAQAAVCSRCRQPRDREGQRYCRSCHNEAQRAQRIRQTERRRVIEAELVALRALRSGEAR